MLDEIDDEESDTASRSLVLDDLDECGANTAAAAAVFSSDDNEEKQAYGFTLIGLETRAFSISFSSSASFSRTKMSDM